MMFAFHKPYGVLSQFTRQSPEHRTLAEFGFPKNVYPIGRLDWDSEGLLLLSNEAKWNDFLLNPRHAHERTYHAQVEGIATQASLEKLKKGLLIQNYRTRPCKARLLADPGYTARVPPIRHRLTIPTSWIELILTEGKNRQVRRMTSAVGHPTLRLVRSAIGKILLGDLPAGQWRIVTPTDLDQAFRFIRK